MDYDADGIPDFISGSYDPGDLYLFRGLGKGRYAARELLRDEAGVPLVHHPKDLVVYHALEKSGKKKDESGKDAVYFRVASFGSWPAMVDWDGDGDLDMLIGSFGGELWLRTNKGSRSKPVFDAASLRVDAGGSPMKVQGHLAPVVADWDGDGAWDVVAGASDGSVRWFRNTGAKTKPVFAAGVLLLPATSKDKFLSQYLAPGQLPERGTRAQICVTDYDGDGKLDLLVGDYSDVFEQRSNLSAEERAELIALTDKEKQLRGTHDEGNGAAKDRNAAKDSGKSLAELIRKKQSFYQSKGRQSHVWLFHRN